MSRCVCPLPTLLHFLVSCALGCAQGAHVAHVQGSVVSS